ncbi:hypothetical protein [Streptomyces sp. cg35]|uniref:hypothetical protein n=1 Tax=Streptomyces sp. cg35 TaxID=3421650 RepID=UPI003D179798
MSQPEPTLGQLWQLIERDSQITRRHVQETLDDVKRRLDSFMTKELWESEKRLLVQRIEGAEGELAAQAARHEALKTKMENDARDQERARQREAAQRVQGRQQSMRDFVYKGIIPALSLLIAVLALWLGAS